MILHEFGLDSPFSHIINGHVPVRALEGESPIKANGKLIVIDGGFCKAYQPKTGIAGYTLVSGSTGMRIIAHEPFSSLAMAIKNNEDIHSSIDIQKSMSKRITIADVDKGKEIKQQINNLLLLIEAYDKGIIKENKEYKYIKVLTKNK